MYEKTVYSCENTLYRRVRYLFWISKVFGLNQYSLPDPQNGVFTILYMFTFLIIILANIMYTIYDGNDLNATQNNIDTKSKLPLITIYVRMMYLILSNVIFYVTCVIKHRDASYIFIYTSQNIDVNLKIINDGQEDHHRNLWDVLLCVVIILAHILGQIIRYLSSYYSIYFLIMYTISSLPSVLLSLQMVILLRNIYSKFSVLNKTLNLNAINKRVLFYDFKYNKYIKKYYCLESILRLHFYLCSVCNVVNEVYGLKILLIIGYDFLVITSILFKLTSLLLSDKKNVNNHFLFGTQLYLFALKCFMLYLIVKTTDCVRKQAIKLLKKGHKLQLKYDLANLNPELQCFIQRLGRHKVSFTAHGFFPLDFTLLYTIVGAATTYLVILVQFQLSYNI